MEGSREVRCTKGDCIFHVGRSLGGPAPSYVVIHDVVAVGGDCDRNHRFLYDE